MVTMFEANTHHHGISHQCYKLLIICIVTITFLIFSLLFTVQDHSKNHLRFFQTQCKEQRFTNMSSTVSFRVRLPSFHPYLPIHMYTPAVDDLLQLNNRTEKEKKRILLGNTMFADPTWNQLAVKNKTNFSSTMSALGCPFLTDYCEITADSSLFSQADAIVYHMRDTINRSPEIMRQRCPSQRFVFVLWESPKYTADLHSYRDFFNWTMTYRFDSHIITSYFSADAYLHRQSIFYQRWLKNLSNSHELVIHENIDTSQKRGTAAALISNCGDDVSQSRLLLIAELQKYTDVTVYGGCGQPCPITILDCRKFIAQHYYFYLSFENSLCQDYTTEKFFNTLKLPIVPVVYGQTDYTRFVPQSAFIDVRNYSSIAQLANRLNEIRKNNDLYQEFFTWKRDFVWNNFSTFMTPFCDLCLRLHLDTTPSIIHDVHTWWHYKTCQS